MSSDCFERVGSLQSYIIVGALTASDGIKRAGRARLVNDAIEIGGEPRRLLVSSFDGAGHSPFIIVVARMPDDAFVLADVRRAMQQVAECCISKTGSPRWS